MFREAAPKIGREVDNLPEQPPGPLDEPAYSNPRSATSEYSPAVAGSMMMPNILQSGENFTVTQSDLANMTVFAGYDEYISYSRGPAGGGSARSAPFFPPFAAMEFMNDYETALKDDYTDHFGVG